ncbi:pyruvate dehydrogenase complex dihydrolipoamide acetyltransferase [Oleiharenicola lentus]|uniref:pyruvate dehydrogenase complex dihydrolipoamide acetyltransferase n=1 Tax=Oleiharenicola lentus TaxID=2508720 RepID=UPI003F667586
MANIIDMPKLSDTMSTGTLVKWLKNEGDVVKAGDMLAEVETDKATMELESFFDGTIVKIFAPAGSVVTVGAPLCAVGTAGEKVDAPAAGGAAPAAKKAEDAPAAEEKKTAAAAPEEKPAKTEAAPAAEESDDTDAADESKQAAVEKAEQAPAAAAKPATTAPAVTGPAQRIKISPLAKKVAAQHQIDPSRLVGTGPGGRIVKADVLGAVADPTKLKSPSGAAPSGSAASAKSAAPLPAGASFFAKGPIQEARTVAASNMRATIAKRLLEAKTQIPHFYLEIELDAEPLSVLRQQLNGALEKEGVKLSVNDFILKASAEALRRVPGVNASWTGTGIQYHAAAHVSFAVAIEDGLITPVIKDTHTKTVFQISAEAKPLGKRAKEKKLKPDEFTGGTFCVSNLGMMGITKFSAIINPPNAAILAVGTTVTKPVVKDGAIVIGQTLVLTLSCDHRVVDGALGAQFLGALKDLLEKPALLLV